MRVRAILLLMGLALLAPQNGLAHSKSLSFSDWQWQDKTLTVSFTTPARDATILPAVAPADDATETLTDALSAALAAHVTQHMRLKQMDTLCRQATPFTAAPAREGYIRIIGSYQCFDDEALISIENHAFFNLARTHVHFARLGRANDAMADSTEVLFTATQRQHFIKPATNGGLQQHSDSGDTFSAYFGLGVAHILTGYDHLAFLVCLLLLARTQRRAIWLVSGFTIGHSLTLALAALGLVVPNAAVVEAIIGASIALLAAETVLARAGLMPRFGLIMAALLFVLSGLALFTGSALPLGAWAGLMLFVLCYGQLIESEADTQLYAPVITAAFGLVHGFGFAGLLTAIGLPTGNILLGLVGFNLGVEFGQLLVLVPLFFLGPIVLQEFRHTKWLAHWRDALAAALACFGTFLFVSRALLG